MTLYQELKEAGAKMDNHESDLYVVWTPVVSHILKKHNVRTAGSFHSEGQVWLDIPFMFDPFWLNRLGTGETS